MFNKIWSIRLNKYECLKSSDKSYLAIDKFNLFIGVNNSGKSRLIRSLFVGDKNELSFSSNQIQQLLESKTILGMRQYAALSDDGHRNREAVLPSEMRTLLDGCPLTQEERNNLIQKYNVAHRWITTGVAGNLTIGNDLRYRLEEDARQKSYPQIDPIINNQDHIYIPILRGMRPVEESKDSYLSRTIADYFKGTILELRNHGDETSDQKRDHKISIVTGLHLYELFTKHLLGKPEQRKAIARYEKLLGDEFFEGKAVTLIPAYHNDTIEIQIGDDPQFPIFNVGDGLQQIIIITSAAFLKEEPSLFFIEEPEQSLHAGLLRQLATFLIEHTNHQYFITTHSNHLLDLIDHRDQITIHKVSKVSGEDKIQITEYSDTDRTLLEELGVRPSSVYLANSTIWVEGITDRLYLRFFMKSYVDKITDEARKAKLGGFLENYHYAFVEYQGGGIAHWNFDDDDVENDAVDGLCAIRASASAFLICDGDTKGKARTLRLQEQLGDRLCVLTHKEIENILPHKVILSTAELIFKNKHKTTKEGLVIDPILKIKEGYFLSPTGIGRLLDDALKLKKKERLLFAEKSGTINEKVKFCNTAIKYMTGNPKDWEITPELDELCTKIFAHIEGNN